MDHVRKKLSVLLASRVDLFDIRGGDTLQIEKTKEYLEKLYPAEIEAVISTDLNPALKNHDLVHLFNISPRVHDTYAQAVNASKQNKPIILTPLYHNPRFIDEYDKKHRYGLLNLLNFLLPTFGSREIAKNLYRCIKDPRQRSAVRQQIKIGYRNQQKAVLEMADMLVTQSEEEMRQIGKDFGIKKNYAVAPLGVDLPHDTTQPPHPALAHLQDYILCLGRIETRKNQLGIIHAVKNTGIPLVLAGAINPHHKAYFKKIMREIKRYPHSIYIPAVPHAKTGALFARAKVHVNASFYESTPFPFVSLEAAAFGCNVVETIKGYANYTLKNYFEYCDPFSEKSIKNAVLKAYEKPRNHELAERIRAAHRWESAASRIADVYKKVLSD